MCRCRLDVSPVTDFPQIKSALTYRMLLFVNKIGLTCNKKKGNEFTGTTEITS